VAKRIEIGTQQSPLPNGIQTLRGTRKSLGGAAENSRADSH
jgi:hypothetical protein